MSDYNLIEIKPNDKRNRAKQETLLKAEGLETDKNLDYSIGLFDEDYKLAATGSCYKNTLRCMAVDSALQGEGLLNQLLTYLTEYQLARGYKDLFLYTKCSSAKFFSDLGFNEIARVDQKIVFMENKKNGFSSYLNRLKEKSPQQNTDQKGCAAIVMNANPFTLGHQHLVEQAASESSLVHLFVVSEDSSLVPFSIRYHLVKEGTKHLTNIVYHTTDSYMISNATFPSYFLKEEDTVVRSHAALDISIFLQIAKTLSIEKRYVGEEPFSHITGLYNEVMSAELKQNGLNCIVIPRKKNLVSAISASAVRALIAKEQWEELKDYVPLSTYDYLLTEDCKLLREQIRLANPEFPVA